jgi:biopolymer transport protein ExbD
MRINLDSDDSVEVQMAPLIDCVFLLLIFFLVATTLKKIEKELPLELPEATASVSRPVTDDMTIVAVDRDGNLYLGSEPVGQGYLQRKLREIAAEHPFHRIRIDGDRNAPAWSLVRVLDLCTFEGLKNVRIRTRHETPSYR